MLRGTDSELCPIVDFCISGIEPIGKVCYTYYYLLNTGQNLMKSTSLTYIPRSTNSLRLSAAWVQVMAITFASFTSRYFERSSPLRSNSNARNSSSWVNIFSIYLLKMLHLSHQSTLIS